MQAEVVIVLGKRGHGKSTWSRAYTSRHARLLAWDPLGDVVADYTDGAGLIERFDAGDLAPGKSFRFASRWADDLEVIGSVAMLAGDCLVLIEECSIAFGGKGTRMPQWAGDMVFLGRHRGVSLLATAQRAVSIPIDLRSQATRLVTFAQWEGDDIGWLKQFLGPAVDEVPALPPYVCLDADSFGAVRYKVRP